jgi:diketogulonate reductase-like aldo/keto reductase
MDRLDQPTAPLSQDVQIPLLGFGTWQLRGHSAYEAVGWALESGYRHLDTATMYRNESELGRALHDSGISRNEIFITTKLPPNRAGNERATLEQSLDALGTDRVDLWLIHWPVDGSGLSTWEAFAKAAEEGLARSIGVSNYSLSQIDHLLDGTGVAPALNQIRWSPFLFDGPLLEGHRERNVVLEGYSPFRAANLEHPVLLEVARQHEKTPAQVVLRWHLEHEIVVIPKSARKERIEANFDVFDFSLSADEVSALDRLSDNN